MGKKSSAKKARQQMPSSVEKGRIVESIVALLHETPGFEVKSHQFLSPVGGGANREIDVLVTPMGGDASLRVMIECKNYKEVVGIELIDAFVGKLLDVGIPANQGVFVCVNGYTADAKGRAQRAGIQLLTLHGLTQDRLSSAVIDAFQSRVFLLLEVLSLTVTNTLPELPTSSLTAPYDAIIFRDKGGHVCGTMPDLVWQKWLSGQIPLVFGEQNVELQVPVHWLPVIGGKEEPVLAASTKVRVLRLVSTLKGQARDHALVNAFNSIIEKRHLNISFASPTEPVPVNVITNETEWVEHLNRPGAVTITHRQILLPRILITSAYYPLSDRVALRQTALMKAFDRGEIPDPRPFTLAEVEGTALETIWEPIMSDHPAIRKGDFINWIEGETPQETA